MKALAFSICLIISILSQTTAQNTKQLYGNVFNENGEALIGATVLWEGTDLGTATDEHGDFWLPKQADTANIVIQYVGYKPLTVEVYPS